MIIFLSLSLNMCLGALKNHLNESHRECLFWLRNKKIIFINALLSGGLVKKCLLTNSWLSCGTHDVITCKEKEIHFKKIYHFL